MTRTSCIVWICFALLSLSVTVGAEEWLDIQLSKSSFVPGEQVGVTFYGSGKARRIAYAAYKLPALEAALRQRYEWGFASERTRATGKLVRRGVIIVGAKDISNGRFSKLRYLEGFPAGDYVLEFSFGNRTRSRGITVTMLGLLSKISASRGLVYAVDLRTGRPAAGAAMDVYSGKKKLAAIRANSQGLATFAVNRKSQENLLLLARYDNFTASVNPWVPWEDGRYKIYLYTERPIYRPGQQVFFKGIARARDKHGYRVLANRKMILRFENADGAVIEERAATTDKFGVFHGRLDLGNIVPLGNYHIRAQVAGEARSEWDAHGIATFAVEEYKKPIMKAEITPDKSRYISGETAQIKISARYYWGGPVSAASARIRVYKNRYYRYWWADNNEDKEFFGDSEDYRESYGTDVSSHDLVLDANGEATLNLPTQPEHNDMSYTVSVEIREPGGSMVEESESFLVTVGSFYLTARPKRWFVPIGGIAEIEVQALTYEGAPVANTAVSVEARRGSKAEYKQIDLLTTNMEGRAVLTRSISQNGYLEFAFAAQENQRRIQAETGIYAASDAGWWSDEGDTKDLTIVADKSVYEPGDTATLLIVCPKKVSHGLFTMEAEEVISSAVLQVKNNAIVRKIRITKDMAPNIYVTFFAAEGPRSYSGEKQLFIRPQANLLSISITTDREQFKPGDTVRYTVDVRDQAGAPCVAEGSLGVVDESIYALRSEPARELEKFFYGRRDKLVNTEYSFSRSYLAGAKEEDRVQVRRDFRDTAFWQSSFVTDAQGRAELDVKIPDNLTTWRATVRVADAETRVGSKIQKNISRRDFLINSSLPRFYVEGDEGEIAVSAFNYTNRSLSAEIWAKSDALGLDTPKNLLSLQPSDSKLTRFRVKAMIPGDAKFTAYATAGNFTDGEERTIRILPHAVLKKSAATLSLGPSESDKSAALALPQATKIHSATLYLNPSLASAMLDAVGYMNSYDYGTSDAAIGWFLPNVSVSLAFKKLGIEYPEISEELTTRVLKSLQNIYKLHVDGEGWGFSVYDNSDAFFTAYVLYGLEQARRAGFQVNDYFIKCGRKWLKGQLKYVSDPSNRALALYVLTLCGEDVKKHLLALQKQTSRLQNYANALLCLAFAEAKMPFYARKTAALLEKSAKVDNKLGYAYWPEIYTWGFYSCNEFETTGYALKALIAANPRSPLIEKAVKWLLAKRQGAGWVSTEDTGSVIYALCDYLALKRPSTESFEATVILNGQRLAQLSINPSNAYQPLKVNVSPDSLRPEVNTLEVRNKSGGELYATLQVVHYDAGQSIAADSSGGVTVAREYRIRRRAYDKAGNAIFAYEPFTGTITAGDELAVRLTVTPKGKCKSMILEDPLPSGFEFVPDDREYGEYWYWDYWYSRRERRDTMMRFYLSELSSKAYTVDYVIRAERAGSFHALPAQVYNLYDPTFWGCSDETVVVVR